MKLARFGAAAVLVLAFGLLSGSDIGGDLGVLAKAQPDCTVTVQPGESIQQAIDQAAEGDVICLAEGIWATSQIERYRKGEAILSVIDEAGKPVAGAQVRYTQVNHDFLFGVGMTRPTPPYHHPLSLYHQLKEARINYALPWLSWGHLEPRPGEFDWRFVDQLFMPNELRELGYTLNGHCFIWFYDGYGNLPGYLRSLSFSELLEAIYHHTYEVSSYYKDAISQWEIAEPIMQNALNLTLEQWLEVIRTVKRAVEEADPRDQVMINLWPTPIPEAGYDPHTLFWVPCSVVGWSST